MNPVTRTVVLVVLQYTLSNVLVKKIKDAVKHDLESVGAYTTEACNGGPVWCQRYSYLFNSRAS